MRKNPSTQQLTARRGCSAVMLGLLAACSAAPSPDATVSSSSTTASALPIASAPQPAPTCSDKPPADLAAALKQPGFPFVAPRLDDQGRFAWSAIEWWSCGKSFPLHVAKAPVVAVDPLAFQERIGADVYGAMVTADRSWLFVVQMGPYHYAGAISPMTLGDVELTAVNLSTLEAHRLAILRTHESMQSVAIASQGSKLSIQWRDVGNGSLDVRTFESCDLTSYRCEKLVAAPAALAESHDVLEVTAMATYAGRKAEAVNLGKNDVLARTLRASPSGDHIAFVTASSPDVDKEHLPPRRSLWLHERKSKATRLVASGRTMFEPVWLSEHELVYRPETEPTPALEAKIAEVAARGAARGEPPATPEAAVRERSFFVELAAREAIAAGLPFERALRFPLRQFDVRTGKDVEVYAGPAAPFGHPSRPDLHHKGRTHEVPD